MRLHIFNTASRPAPTFHGQGQLKNGQPYEIHQLTLEHLDSICTLHQEIHDSLKPEERTFISKKNREDFQDYLTGHGVILGAFCGGRLVSMGSLLLPTIENPYTCTADMKLSAPPQHVAVLQSDSVLPSYRGQGIHDKLIEARVAVAKDLGRHQALALADTKNMATIKNFLQAGFAITGLGTDPDDGGKIFHMQKHLRKDRRILGIKCGTKPFRP